MKAQLCLLEERVAAAPFGENMRCQACRNRHNCFSSLFTRTHPCSDDDTPRARLHPRLESLLCMQSCTVRGTERHTHTCQPFCALVLYLTKTLRRGGAFTSHNTPATQIDRKRTILERGLVNGSLQGPTWSLSQYHFFYGCVKTCKI